MAFQQLLLSPAELSYIHTSLSVRPPIRPDGRSSTQFRPLTAETGILPGTNGSARVCFADGTEAIVGVKAEVEKTPSTYSGLEDGDTDGQIGARGSWLEMTVDIPGLRDDDAGTVFLSEMLREALLTDGEFAEKLKINRRFHWRLYLDIILISPPMSYPLPLLSLTTHLALLAARIPLLKSEGDEDPMFDDDWEASEFLYQQARHGSGDHFTSRPPVTLLVVVVGNNIIFDPSKEELAVAETALAISVAETQPKKTKGKNDGMGVNATDASTKGRALRLLSVRTIDPPSRLTAPGVPNEVNAATNVVDSGKTGATKSVHAAVQGEQVYGVWRAPLGGTKFAVMDAVIDEVLKKGGVGEEVLDGLESVDLA